MPDETKKLPTECAEQACEGKKDVAELSDADLNEVSGGRAMAR